MRVGDVALGVQVVGYETGVGDDEPPALQVAVDGAVSREPLAPGRELEYSLGQRRCAGVVDGDDHVACDASAAPYCQAHDSTWVCARCTGTCLKAEMDCHQEHAIYLAAFAPSTFKVGVTRRSDPRVRLREQGADRGAIIRRVSNGRIAREIEADIAASEPLSDVVRTAVKVAGLGKSIDETAWERLLSRFEVSARHSFGYGLGLDVTPVAETLAAGTVRGTKGRILVLDRGDDTFAVDMRALVGYEVRSEPPSRRLQSSLGRFE